MNKPQQFRIYDEKYRYWDNTPLVIYPNTPIVKQGRVIQWYSGLNDSKGVPIYEGDILREWICNETKTNIGVCRSVLGGWKIFSHPDSSICWHGWKQEVVGNIFDTPELLRG